MPKRKMPACPSDVEPHNRLRSDVEPRENTRAPAPSEQGCVTELVCTLQSRGSEGVVHTTSLTLTCPDEGEECPITMEPMKDDSLAFLPSGTTMHESYPKFTKATLECNHSFGALTLLYHMAINGMTCPCCREGSAEKLDPRCLPIHFRKAFDSHMSDRGALEDATNTRRDEVSSDLTHSL